MKQPAWMVLPGQFDNLTTGWIFCKAQAVNWKANAGGARGKGQHRPDQSLNGPRSGEKSFIALLSRVNKYGKIGALVSRISKNHCMSKPEFTISDASLCRNANEADKFR